MEATRRGASSLSRSQVFRPRRCPTQAQESAKAREIQVKQEVDNLLQSVKEEMRAARERETEVMEGGVETDFGALFARVSLQEPSTVEEFPQYFGDAGALEEQSVPESEAGAEEGEVPAATDLGALSSVTFPEG